MALSSTPAGDSNSKVTIALTFGLILFCLSFLFFTPFTHHLFAAKGNLAVIKQFTTLAKLAAEYRVTLGLSALAFFLSAFSWITALRLNRGHSFISNYFSSRLGISILLATIVLCQVSINFSTEKLIDRTDANGNINESVEAGKNLRMGEWPFYSFTCDNGTTTNLQHPPLASGVFGGILYFLNPADPAFNNRIVVCSIHILLTIGLYRLFRVWRFERFACAVVALALTGSHQMMIFDICGTNATYLAIALAVWATKTFIKWLQIGHIRYALSFGLWLGLVTQAHPVTALILAYFLTPIGLLHFWNLKNAKRITLLTQAGAAGFVCASVCLYYLLSIFYFNRFNTFKPGNEHQFSGPAANIHNNFLWLFKYMGNNNPNAQSAGEYIGITLTLVGLTGLILLIRDFIRKEKLPRPYYIASVILFFLVGTTIFYARDTTPIGYIPAIHLTRQYIRLFLYPAIGLGLLAVRPLSLLISQRNFKFVTPIALLLLLDLAPFWLRPVYNTNSPEFRLDIADFSSANRDSSCFYVIGSNETGGIGATNDAVFRFAGYRGMCPIDYEEMSVIGKRYLEMNERFLLTTHPEEIRSIIEELKWFRVTHLVLQTNLQPEIDLAAIVSSRAVTHGTEYLLNGPQMKRSLREVQIEVVPEDLRIAGMTLLPIGYSPFLHARLASTPKESIPLLNHEGYTAIKASLPVGTPITIRAITPTWLSLATWFSLFSFLGWGFYLLLFPFWTKSRQKTHNVEMLPMENH